MWYFKCIIHEIDCNAILLGVCSSLFMSVCGSVTYWDINSDSSWYTHPSSTPNKWTTSSLASGEIKEKPLSDFCY